jgi:ubiquinone/menaquinone biosynthesis C-methylase UbiE
MKLTSKPLFVVENAEASYFPAFLTKPFEVEISTITYWYYRFLLFIIYAIIRFRLRMVSWRDKYKKKSDSLTNDEVAEIYRREAKTYERKHHLTTNFRDTWWRRQSGTDVISYAKRKEIKTPIKLLDLATGIGLSVEEMFEVFRSFKIKVTASAVDYSEEMLDQAMKIILPRMTATGLLKKGEREVIFQRGDARNLREGGTAKGFVSFHSGSFDCVTMMFGIGGIDNPLKVFEEILLVLKDGGILSLNDMHRSIYEFQERWPFFIGKKNGNAFSFLSWEYITKPLVLHTLWGWRDTTALFYTLPLITAYDKDNQAWYGFEIHNFFLDNEIWWYGIPAMSTARIVVEKVALTSEEAKNRQKILNSTL